MEAMTKKNAPTSISIDKGLRKLAKVYCAERGITMTELFERAIKREIGIA